MEHKELRLLEVDYTPWPSSCRDPHVTPDGQLVQCRRQNLHDEGHATRAGAGLIEWENTP